MSGMTKNSDSKISELQHFYPSEGKIEQFLRGEGPLEFRSAFDINDSELDIVERAADGSELNEQNDTPVRFLAIKGTATTSNVDDNGIDVVPSALRSLPNDFERRSTVLFNHDYDWPIGKMPKGTTKYIPAKSESDYARVDVDPVLIDLESRALDGVRFADKIENGILRTFSIGWSTKDGIVVLDEKASAQATPDELAELGYENDGDVLMSFRIGTDQAPKVRVLSMTGIELSVVSAPADADSDFTTANFGRSLSRALHSFKRTENSIFVPASFVEEEEEDEEITVEVDPPADCTGIDGSREDYNEILPSRAPWNEKHAIQRLIDHYDSEVDWHRFVAQGDTDEDFAFMHHDVRNGLLYSNEIAILRAIQNILESDKPDDNDQALRHFSDELIAVHGREAEELPEGLIEYFKNKEV